MCSPHGEREAVLQQELVIHIGWIISNNPELFSGMLKIRVGWIVQAMKHELKIRAGDMPPKDIYQMSPSAVKQLLLDVLQPQQTGRSWLNRRQIDGSLNRTPLGFYDRVWQILERTRNGIMLGGKHLPQNNMETFYNTPALGKQNTSSYLSKAVMIQLLQGEVKPSKDDPCSVS
ncbi:hypothetical protein cypCar_00042856 [Cyprinus carpio]|nr:hypothetical protein cypCar_00042856 [Cyprinus carpio]